jgi:hypothetical protein
MGQIQLNLFIDSLVENTLNSRLTLKKLHVLQEECRLAQNIKPIKYQNVICAYWPTTLCVPDN